MSKKVNSGGTNNIFLNSSKLRCAGHGVNTEYVLAELINQLSHIRLDDYYRREVEPCKNWIYSQVHICILI